MWDGGHELLPAVRAGTGEGRSSPSSLPTAGLAEGGDLQVLGPRLPAQLGGGLDRPVHKRPRGCVDGGSHGLSGRRAGRQGGRRGSVGLRGRHLADGQHGDDHGTNMECETGRGRDETPALVGGQYWIVLLPSLNSTTDPWLPTGRGNIPKWKTPRVNGLL